MKKGTSFHNWESNSYMVILSYHTNAVCGA